MKTLLDGKPGTPMQTFSGIDLRHLSVSHGVAVIHALDDGNAKQLIT